MTGAEDGRPGRRSWRRRGGGWRAASMPIRCTCRRRRRRCRRRCGSRRSTVTTWWAASWRWPPRSTPSCTGSTLRALPPSCSTLPEKHDASHGGPQRGAGPRPADRRPHRGRAHRRPLRARHRRREPTSASPARWRASPPRGRWCSTPPSPAPGLSGSCHRSTSASSGEDQLVATPADVLHPLRAGAPSSLVLVGGPSRTGDVEQILTLGVHGPRHVHILLVAPA